MATTAILVFEELTADDITALLEEDNSKGWYMRVITDLVKSGDIYTVVKKGDTEQAALVQSLKLNLAKCKKDDTDGSFPDIRIVKKGDVTLLVNVAAHAAALAAKQS